MSDDNPLLDEQTADIQRKRLFMGEMQLLKWSEDHNQGAKVVLQLAETDALEAFKRMTTRHGKIAGQRLLVVCWEIGADEQLVDQRDANAMFEGRGKAKGGAKCTLAGIWCGNPQFHEWLKMRHRAEWERAQDTLREKGLSMVPGEVAAEVVRIVCHVGSRRELDSNEAAGRRFDELLRRPFNAMLSERGEAE